MSCWYKINIYIFMYLSLVALKRIVAWTAKFVLPKYKCCQIRPQLNHLSSSNRIRFNKVSVGILVVWHARSGHVTSSARQKLWLSVSTRVNRGSMGVIKRIIRKSTTKPPVANSRVYRFFVMMPFSSKKISTAATEHLWILDESWSMTCRIMKKIFDNLV